MNVFTVDKRDTQSNRRKPRVTQGRRHSPPQRFRSLHGENFVEKGGKIQRLYGLGARMSCETYMRVLVSCPVPWYYSHNQGNS